MQGLSGSEGPVSVSTWADEQKSIQNNLFPFTGPGLGASLLLPFGHSSCGQLISPSGPFGPSVYSEAFGFIRPSAFLLSSPAACNDATGKGRRPNEAEGFAVDRRAERPGGTN